MVIVCIVCMVCMDPPTEPPKPPKFANINNINIAPPPTPVVTRMEIEGCTVIVTQWWTTARPFRKDGPIEVVELWKDGILRCHTENWCTRRYKFVGMPFEAEGLLDKTVVYQDNDGDYRVNTCAPLHRDDGPAFIEITYKKTYWNDEFMTRCATWVHKGQNHRMQAPAVDKEVYYVNKYGIKTMISIKHQYYCFNRRINNLEIFYENDAPIKVIQGDYEFGPDIARATAAKSYWCDH